MRKLTPRAAFIKNVDLKRLAAFAWDAMQLASSHDPDHAKQLEECRIWLLKLERRLDVIDRQMERIGAPQYRVVYKGKRKPR